MSTYRHFKDLEFRLARPACSLSDMDHSFMQHLDLAREKAGIPFKINSAFRSVEYEKSQGRKGTSSHCFGLAVDIRCTTSVQRLKIVSALLEVGFERIGIGKTFIHVDYDQEKNAAIWLY